MVERLRTERASRPCSCRRTSCTRSSRCAIASASSSPASSSERARSPSWPGGSTRAGSSARRDRSVDPATARAIGARRRSVRGRRTGQVVGERRHPRRHRTTRSRPPAGGSPSQSRRADLDAIYHHYFMGATMSDGDCDHRLAPERLAAVTQAARPSLTGGWRIVARKEFADHVHSVRFVILVVLRRPRRARLGALGERPDPRRRRRHDRRAVDLPLPVHVGTRSCAGVPRVHRHPRAAARHRVRLRRHQRRAIAAHAAAARRRNRSIATR